MNETYKRQIKYFRYAHVLCPHNSYYVHTFLNLKVSTIGKDPLLRGVR